MKHLPSTIIAISAGVFILYGYYSQNEMVIVWHDLLIHWTIGLWGFFILVGVITLLINYLRKTLSKKKNENAAWLVVMGFLTTTILYFLFQVFSFEGLSSFYRTFQVPFETSIMGMISITLIGIGFNAFRSRRGFFITVFAISSLVYLLFYSGVALALFRVPWMGSLLGALQLLPSIGMRGLLIGIALGGLIAGVRVLLGMDRPYNG